MRILIYISIRSNSKPAVQFGGLLARSTQSSVTLLTVIESTRDLTAAHQALDASRLWIPHLSVDTSVRIGEEINGILEEIDRGNYDLVVLKARQAMQIKDFLSTKLGQRVARQAPISVLVVKQPQPQLKRILICTSGVDVADPVIATGSRLAQANQARVTLLHVTGAIPSMYTGLSKIEEHLPEILQTDTPMARHLRQAASVLAERNVEAELELRHGAVADEILLEAQKGNYDLIMLGDSRASANLAGWLMGDVTYHIINNAQCPVLVVRRHKNLSDKEITVESPPEGN